MRNSSARGRVRAGRGEQGLRVIGGSQGDDGLALLHRSPSASSGAEMGERERDTRKDVAGETEMPDEGGGGEQTARGLRTSCPDRQSFRITHQRN